jgi:flagellar biogenesis protein FliO
MDLVSGLRFVLALVVVIGLIAGLAWLLRKYGAGRITMGANCPSSYKLEQLAG